MAESLIRVQIAQDDDSQSVVWVELVRGKEAIDLTSVFDLVPAPCIPDEPTVAVRFGLWPCSGDRVDIRSKHLLEG